MYSIHNPATNSTICSLSFDSNESIAEKAKKAQEAFPQWSKTTLEHRKTVIEKFKNLLIEKKETLARILSSETGKPVQQALNEINGTPQRIDFFLENFEVTLQEQRVFPPSFEELPDMEEVLTWEPLGTIVNISAWNYPYFVGTNVIVPALLTGNTVLYKPSELALLTGIEIGKMMHQAGVPQDVFQVILGGGKEGAELLQQDIQGVFFTGSYLTGKKIAEMVAGRMIRVQLELGGKDPVYVCEDVDPKLAAEGLADGAFYNAGQSCCSVERIYIHDAIYDDFVKHFIETVQGFVVGDPDDLSTYIGPLTRKEQIASLEKQVQDALEKGAVLETGGKAMEGTGSYFEPTVFTNVDHDMLLMKEESFGPIIGLMRVFNDNEAIEKMNDTEYGLTAGVYTQSKTRAKKILQSIQSGTVYWNCCDRVSPRLPWTGRKHSGQGSTLSIVGIQAFLQPKGWHFRR